MSFKEKVPGSAKPDYDLFLQFYDEIFRQLYSYFSRRVKTKTEVHDLLRATFSRAIRLGKDFSTENVSREVWFYRQAHVILSEYRGRAGKGEKIGGFLSPPREECFSYQDNFVRDLFKEFSFFEAELVWLKYFEKLANPEIAYVTGLAGSEVGGYIYKVLKKAQNLLHQY